MFRYHFFRILSVFVFAVCAVGQFAAGGVGPSALAGCSELGYSTEIPFLTRGPEPPDGNPMLSDGDLLGYTAGGGCVVCARNDDLLSTSFDVSEDIGLDAADVIDVSNYRVAFSTEVDSPNMGQFTAGDLLVTNGAVIPNQVLLYEFGTFNDLGLDAIHFVGTKASIMAFIDMVVLFSRDTWLQNPERLTFLLDEYNVDILFSTEIGSSLFSEGDLLSAREGKIVEVCSDLINLGLDAVAGTRDGEAFLYSTEVDGDGFGEGDILGGCINAVMTHWELIFCFEPEPNVEFVGLDALSVNFECASPPSMDFTGDCRVGLEDFALFAEEWLACGYLLQELCW